MQNLRRNESEIHYALRTVTVEQDAWGNTYEAKGYTEPMPLKISVSANKGEAEASGFGADLSYDKEMVTHDMACPIDEYSHLWLDGRSPTETHNFEVAAVSKSLNCIRYAVRRVNVSR